MILILFCLTVVVPGLDQYWHRTYWEMGLTYKCRRSDGTYYEVGQVKGENLGQPFLELESHLKLHLF